VAFAVLIVDDSPHFRAAATELLTARGFAVLAEVAGAEQALERATKACPDGILLDINLSGVDGFTAARSLSAVCPGCRIVLTSANITDVPAGLLQSSGASAFVFKEALASADLDALFMPEGR
jgi:CheY-like chemotaxis protein